MSWKALDWATESDIGSPTIKFVLHLLANKADEDFSCYPSIRTLMAESDAGRSTVMRALKELEAKASSHGGHSSTIPEHSDPPATTSTTPKHPIPPRFGTPRSRTGTGPVSPRTGTVPQRGPTGGAKSGHLEPPIRTHQLEPPFDATRALAALTEPWRIARTDAKILIPAIEAALASGWTLENLIPHISHTTQAASEAPHGSWLDA